MDKLLPQVAGRHGAVYFGLNRNEVVVLLGESYAQATIARVLAVLPEGERRVPILSSPHLALAQISELLQGNGEEGSQ